MSRVAGWFTEGFDTRDLKEAKALLELPANNKPWELRGAMSLARLWRDRSKGQQAHELLAPAYDLLNCGS
jgi:hypothetical protein